MPVRDEIRQLPYIDLPSRAQPILAGLNRAIQRRRIGTLIGPRGSGKSRLIDSWLQNQTGKSWTHDEVVWIRLRPAHHIPMYCVVYSRIWHELRKRKRPPYMRTDDDAIDGTIYSERQLQSVHL